MIYSEYLDENANLVFVSSGISGGKVWMTVRQKPSQKGTHRIKTKYLPIRHSMDEAQADLDTYAEKKGWQKHEPAAEEKPPPPPAPKPSAPEEKTISLCPRCLVNFTDAFPIYRVVKGETGKGKCGHCGKRKDDVTTCAYTRREKAGAAA